MSLSIQIRDQKSEFSPGERILGEATWQLDQQPKIVEMRLVWSSSGKGSSDSSVVETYSFADPQMTETRSFNFMLPNGPYSFRGTLIELKWHLHLFVEPSSENAVVEICVAPGGRAVVLPKISTPSSF
jgi:hypothetical protein